MTETVRQSQPRATPLMGARAPALFDRYRLHLQEALRAAVPGGPGICDPLRYHMGWENRDGTPVVGASQGKCLRPTLCLFACEAVGGRWEDALPAAVALELVHNFSLIHDDIQDGDRERRHRPTVWALWGKPRALWAGNALRCIADLSLTTSGHTSSEHRTHASRLLTQRYLEMIEGQYLDLSYEGRLDIGIDDYIYMVSRKTGALIRGALELGALMARRSDAIIDAMGRCGHLLGLAFQIKDDVLGIWGDSATTGKAAGNDIWRRKKSFPVAYALHQSSGAQRTELERIYTSDALCAEDVELVLAALDALGARAYSESCALKHAEQALDAVAGLGLDSWAMEALEEMVQFLVAREY